MWISARLAYLCCVLCLSLAFISIASCSKSSEGENHLGERLCSIYESVLAEDLGRAESAMQISERIKAELPDYYQNHHVPMAVADPENRYEVMKEVVRLSSGIDWECDAVKKFLEI